VKRTEPENILTDHYHTIVWIDHQQARVIHLTTDKSDLIVVHPVQRTLNLHHKANSVGSGHAAEDQKFLHEVVSAIGTAGAVMVAGPANAKNELVKHIEHHDPRLRERVVAIETLDHPSDGELTAHARKFFKAFDRMSPQRHGSAV
jgi:stalled ribosome rescue protein Dom34